MPDVSDTLTDYLRTFSLWCRHGFADKISDTTALPGVLLQANDAPAGTTPTVFMLQVKTDGTIVAHAGARSGARRTGAMTAQPYHQKLARVLDRMGGALHAQRHPDRDRRRQDAELRRQQFLGDHPGPGLPARAAIAAPRRWSAISPISTPCTPRSWPTPTRSTPGCCRPMGGCGWLREGSCARLGWRLKATSHLYQKEL